jgi:TRAP-type C4-dicarboxylate transport system substrate-binding protein
MTPEGLFISKRIWDKLKPEQQKQLREAAKASVVVERERWDAQEAKALAIVKAAGAQVVDTDRAPFRKAVQPVIAKFVNTPELQALLKSIENTQ